MMRLIGYNKYRTLFSLVVGWFLYYACRKTFSSTMPHLMAHRGFSEEDLGLIASSFSVSYGIYKLLFGIVADHVNSRKLFSTGLLLSGLCVVLMSFGKSTLLCCIVWFLQGIAQGFGWPAALKLLKAWCSPETLGIWWSVVSSAASLSSTLSPLLIAYVTSVSDWYVNYYIVGGVAGLSALAMYGTIADISMATTETSSKYSANKNSNSKKSTDFSYGDLLLCKELWFVSFIYFVLYIGKYSLSDWGQLYFIQHLKFKETSAGACVGMIQFGGVFGNVIWGYVSDRSLSIMPKGSKVPRGPALLLSCTSLTICLYFFSSSLYEGISEFSVSCICFFTGLMLEGCVSLIGLAAMESVPDQLTGSAHAMSCAFGQVGGFIAGWPFSLIVSNYSWAVAYQLLTLVSVLMVASSIYITLLGCKTSRTSKLHSE